MFVQGHGQKSEQKHRTKNFAKLPKHLSILTMVWLTIILRELLQAIAIFEEAIVTDVYNPLWLDWIDVVLREVAEGV